MDAALTRLGLNGWVTPELLAGVAAAACITALIGALIAIFLYARKHSRKNTNQHTPPTAPTTPEPEMTTEDKEKEKKEREEKIEARKKEAIRILRISVPAFLIISNVALGWTNLVHFAHESANIPEFTANFIVAFFTLGALWAAAERYKASKQDENTLMFTVLLWGLLFGESAVQFGHSIFYNKEITELGAIFLASLSPVAGLTFEMALQANRKDVRKAKDGEDNREIPGSYKWSPFLYLRLRRLKIENPDWDIYEMVRHARAERVVAAAERYSKVNTWNSSFVRLLLGERSAEKRVRDTLSALNPTGKPDEDPRNVLANLLMVRHAAQDVSLSEGNRLHILTALGVAPPPRQVEANTSTSETPALSPSRDTNPSETEDRDTYSGTRQGDTLTHETPDLSHFVDSFLTEALGTNPGETPEPRQSNSDTGSATPEVSHHNEDSGTRRGDTENATPRVRQKRKRDSATPRKRDTRRRSLSHRTAKKTTNSRKSSKQARINAVADLLVRHRDDGKNEPSVAEVAAHLSKVENNTVSRGSAHRYIKDAKEQIANRARN